MKDWAPTFLLLGLDNTCDEAAARRMAAFDQLPPKVRDALNYSICDFSALEVLNRFETRGEGMATRSLSRALF